MLKKSSSLVAALVLLGSICFSTRAQQQPQGNAEPKSEPTVGAITGRVVNDRGEPMAGASVMVRAVGVSHSRQTITDAEGNFRLAGLEPALYTINSFAPAYVLQPPPPDASTPQTPFYRIGDSVRLELMKGGVITGTVTNATGEPIVGIRVRVMRVRDAEGRTPRAGIFAFGDRPTDDRGVYRIYGLSPGTYLVFAGGGGGQQSVQLNPYESDVPTYSPSSTRDTAAEYSVRGGEETTADIRYRNDPGRTVSGTVRVAAAQNSASVQLFSNDGSMMPVASAFQTPMARGFAVTGVPDGEYLVSAQEVPGGLQGGPVVLDISVSEVKRVSVKGADVTGIELTPRPLSVISGVVVLEPSKAPECQGKRKPLFAEMMIELQRNEKDSESMLPFQRVAANLPSVNANGAFSMRNVTPARYRFNPRFYARYWYLQSITTGASPATAAKNAAAKNDAAANWTTVRAGEQLSNVTITLAAGAASIRGKIAVAEGATAPAGAAVYLVPVEREDVLRYFVAGVSADGAFTLNNLPPGRYWSILQTSPQAEIATLTKLRLPESAEARTKLRRAAEAQKSDVELKPCQTLADYQLSPK